MYLPGFHSGPSLHKNTNTETETAGRHCAILQNIVELRHFTLNRLNVTKSHSQHTKV